MGFFRLFDEGSDDFRDHFANVHEGSVSYDSALEAFGRGGQQPVFREPFAPKEFEVPFRKRIPEHFGIHGRGDKHRFRSVGRKRAKRLKEEVVSDSVHDLRDRVSRRRSEKRGGTFFRDADVADVPHFPRKESLGLVAGFVRVEQRLGPVAERQARGSDRAYPPVEFEVRDRFLTADPVERFPGEFGEFFRMGRVRLGKYAFDDERSGARGGMEYRFETGGAEFAGDFGSEPGGDASGASE